MNRRVAQAVAALLGVAFLGGVFFATRGPRPARKRARVSTTKWFDSHKGRYVKFDASLDPAITPVAAARQWSYIVIHHSGTRGGTMKSIRSVHVEQNGWSDIGYHFVILGTDQDLQWRGAIGISDRWDDQAAGAHAGVAAFNTNSIGICLVGDFDDHAPSDWQLSSLVRLTRALQSRFAIPNDHVLVHRDIKRTACPGRLFREEIFSRRLAQAGQQREVKAEEIEVALRRMGMWIESFMVDTNCTPAVTDVASLRVALQQHGGGGALRDPWQHDIRYLRPSTDPCNGYAIISAGADGQFESWSLGAVGIEPQSSAGDDSVFSNGLLVFANGSRR